MAEDKLELLELNEWELESVVGGDDNRGTIDPNGNPKP
jgi:hypothetical protein